jgi:chromosome segregation ATPase
MSFDIEPDGDPHGECALEIKRLENELSKLKEENERLRESVKIHEGCYADLQDACDEANRLHCERTKQRDQALSELAECKALLNKLRDAAKDMWSRDSVLNRSRLLKVALEELDAEKSEGRE